MKKKRLVRTLVGLLVAGMPAAVLAQFTTPNVINVAGDVTTTLGTTTFVNHGLVGIGRISASTVDPFGETFGSASSLQVTDWVVNGDGSYNGVFNILPDRGYNNGAFYADYAARINRVGFHFVPYTGSANVGGTTDAEKVAAQNQITFTTPISGVKFTYDDPNRGPGTFTTGLDPGTGATTLFGQLLPYVFDYTGAASPSSQTSTLFPNIDRLPLDSEALVLKADGSGYVGDEYGANVYYFDATKKIVNVIVPPPAFQPHLPQFLPNFTSAVTPVDGRRNNQGFEGVSLSPDGTRLFVLLQSSTVQDSIQAANDQRAKNTRLLVYDVSQVAAPQVPLAEYALVLPTYTGNGAGGAVNKTCAQSEVIALDDHRLLVLPRDGNGLGNSSPNPSVFKSVILVDLSIGSPTNFAGDVARNAEGGLITTAPGVLDPAITPLSSTEAVNVLNATQLGKFNVALDTGGQVSKLTLGEKWEGMALTYANDQAHPNDYFLFLGNDNDFLTSSGIMKGPGGTITYDGFAGYPATRVPAAIGSTNHENDTMILAFRVTITPDPTAPVIQPNITGTLGNNGWYTSSVGLTWTVTDPQSGIVTETGCGPTTIATDTAGKTFTCTATNGAGLSSSKSVTIKVDRTAPTFTGLPTDCSVWPPNKKLVNVGTIGASDALSGLASGFAVNGTSSDPTSGDPDIVISPSGSSFTVQVRADRSGNSNGRVYTITATAQDLAGNTASAMAACVVPHDQGKGK